VENAEKRWHRKVMKSIADVAVAIATRFIILESYSD